MCSLSTGLFLTCSLAQPDFVVHISRAAWGPTTLKTTRCHGKGQMTGESVTSNTHFHPSFIATMTWPQLTKRSGELGGCCVSTTSNLERTVSLLNLGCESTTGSYTVHNGPPPSWGYGEKQMKEFMQEHHQPLEKTRSKWPQWSQCAFTCIHMLSLYSHGSQRADTGGWRAWQCLHFYSPIHSIQGTYADGKGTKKTPLTCNLSGAIFNCDATMIKLSTLTGMLCE